MPDALFLVADTVVIIDNAFAKAMVVASTEVEPHCDLAEQLTFYNVSGRTGAARRFNLDFYCRAFGIESPKSQGVTGMDVSDLMAQERYLEIAAYCARDVVATAELYAIWKERLEGVK